VEIDHFELNNQDSAVKPLPTQTLDSFQTGEDILSNATPNIKDETALGFRVGTLGFLLDADIFCEIVDQSKVSPLPNVQPWLNGVLNLRGDIVPVIDLHILLEEKTSPSKNRHLLAVDRGKKTVAFWIDGYPQMLNTVLKPATTQPALPDVLRQATTNCRLLGQQIWLNISLDKLFKALSSHTVQARV
jgi:twitching motility protein PilI